MPAGRTAGIFYFMVMRVTMMCISCSVLRKKRVKMLIMLKCADVFGRNTSCMSDILHAGCRHTPKKVRTYPGGRPGWSTAVDSQGGWSYPGSAGTWVCPDKTLGYENSGLGGSGGVWRGFWPKPPPNPPRPLKTPKTAPKPRF